MKSFLLQHAQPEQRQGARCISMRMERESSYRSKPLSFRHHVARK